MTYQPDVLCIAGYFFAFFWNKANLIYQAYITAGPKALRKDSLA